MLQDLAESVGLQKQGLRALAAATLRHQLAKGNQCSDWQQLELTEQCVPPLLNGCFVADSAHNCMVLTKLKANIKAEACIRKKAQPNQLTSFESNRMAEHKYMI